MIYDGSEEREVTCIRGGRKEGSYICGLGPVLPVRTGRRRNDNGYGPSAPPDGHTRGKEEVSVSSSWGPNH